jgi:hypothetical protein
MMTTLQRPSKLTAGAAAGADLGADFFACGAATANVVSRTRKTDGKICRSGGRGIAGSTSVRCEKQ